MSKTEVIAEIGKNYIDSTRDKQTVEECLVLAKRMVFRAKEAGADVVKFQTHVWEDEKNKRSSKREYWSMLNEKLTPVGDFWVPLKEFCDSIGIEFLTTPMSKKAAEKINHLVGRWKVSSADIVDFDLLQYIKDTKKPVIISTGMSTNGQIDRAVEFLGDQIQLINYCVSIYPCDVSRINLQMINILKEKYNLPVGFSDHSLSTEVAVLAVKMGARSIEKHFTLDRDAFGPDHKASLLPEEFKKMVDAIRKAEIGKENLEEEKIHWDRFRINNN